MNCEHALEHLGPYIEDDLPREVLSRVENHLLTCQACAWEAESQRIVRRRLREGLGESVASDAFRARVVSRLKLDNPHLSPELEPVEPTQYRLPLL